MVENLANSVKNVLAEKGVLAEIRAKIRREIFETLETGKAFGINIENKADAHASVSSAAIECNSKPNAWLRDEMVINDSIVEYFKFHGLQHSLSVFLIESQHKIKASKHETIAEQQQTPAIYSVTVPLTLQQQKQQ